MDIIELTMNNIDEYTDYITEDAAENIERTFYHGLIVIKEKIPIAGMLWEIKNSLSERDVVSNIDFLRIEAEEAAELLFGEYKKSISQDEVEISTFTLSDRLSEKEKKALKNAGFSVELVKDDIVKLNLSEIAKLEFFIGIQPSEFVKPLNRMTQREFSVTLQRFERMGIYGICEDLAFLPRSYFENDVSCYLEIKEKISGIFLIHRSPSGVLKVVNFTTDCKENAIWLPHMMWQTIAMARVIYPHHTEVWFTKNDHASKALYERLFPKVHVSSVYKGDRNEGK